MNTLATHTNLMVEAPLERIFDENGNALTFYAHLCDKKSGVATADVTGEVAFIVDGMEGAEPAHVSENAIVVFVFPYSEIDKFADRAKLSIEIVSADHNVSAYVDNYAKVRKMSKFTHTEPQP